MAMKPVLALRMGQQLRMTPQLQQAIKLLQLSTIELQQEIQDVLDSNLMLEEVRPDEDEDSSEPISPDLPDEPSDNDPAAEDLNTVSADEDNSGFDDDMPLHNAELDGDVEMDSHDHLSSDNIAEDLPVDTVWEDAWDDAPPSSGHSDGDDGDDSYLEARNTAGPSLQAHLEEQIRLMNLSETDALIAMTIIDGLDKDGVLTLSLEEIVESLALDFEVGLDEALAVLHLIQHLDPVGVAARDLKECLLIQLNQLAADSPWRASAISLVSKYLDYLANRDYALLLRKTHLKEHELKCVIELIQTLNPRPGADFAADNTEYVDPDVLVSKQNDRWVVELNPKSAPRIRVNPEYAALVRRADSSSDNTYLKNHLQEARWFIKSLQQRNETLLKVATRIVEVQRGFFEYGEQAMKPLVLHDIAEAVGLHESTISRVTTQKYMHTPAGVFELKYFFSSHVGTHTGGEVSSTAIRALIKNLVSEENPRKPLSDSKIADLLADQNIKVARRTIAKYRESLLIPPSNERKQLV
jgi:RNA polymerase sigma-54 factor